MNNAIRKQLAPLLKGPLSACWKKNRYVSEQKARQRAERRMKSSNCTDKLYVYRCPICREWHITKMEQPQ